MILVMRRCLRNYLLIFFGLIHFFFLELDEAILILWFLVGRDNFIFFVILHIVNFLKFKSIMIAVSLTMIWMILFRMWRHPRNLYRRPPISWLTLRTGTNNWWWKSGIWSSPRKSSSRSVSNIRAGAELGLD